MEETQIEKLFSVDPFITYCESGHNQNHWNVFYMYTRDKLSQFGERSELIRETSKDASVRIDAGFLDFIFIDACHQFDFVKQDLELWYDKIRSGGLIAGDDYADHNLPGVTLAVNQFFAEKGLKVYQHPRQSRFWWVIKP